MANEKHVQLCLLHEKGERLQVETVSKIEKVETGSVQVVRFNTVIRALTDDPKVTIRMQIRDFEAGIVEEG